MKEKNWKNLTSSPSYSINKHYGLECDKVTRETILLGINELPCVKFVFFYDLNSTRTQV